MGARGAIARITLAVLGGWLAIMPGAVLILALRMREFDPSGLPTHYSMTLACGWLVMIVSLIALGQAGDVLERRGRSRLLLVRMAVPLLPVTGVALALASTPLQLSAAWTLAQVPAAAIVTSALALSGATVPTDRRGVLSGLAGAAPIVALLVGGLIVQASADTPPVAFAITAVAGALLTLPLALMRHRPRQPELDIDRRSPTERRPWWATAWWAFAVASLLLAWATSTANGYLVVLLDNLSTLPAAEVPSAATATVTGAAAVAVGASVVGGLVVRGRRSAALAWSGAAVCVAVVLGYLLVHPTSHGLVFAALGIGLGFGVANGTELGLVLFLRHEAGRLGRDLGVFTAMTSIPYVLVPLAATVLLGSDVDDGLHALFALAVLLALVGSVITAGIGITARRAAA